MSSQDPERSADSGLETAAASLEAMRAASPTGRFAPGTLLAGRYRIVAPLGRGGMGEVYRADDIRLGQPVALKFLPAALAAQAGRLELLEGEVRIGRQVSHPNVCRLYDIGEAEGQHFLVMEYVDGEDLASLLRRIGRLPGGKALEIARGICAGLAAAHDKGVIHRDLKPANVMIDGNGHARIADFGLAAIAEHGKATDLSGTPAYMAPEQLAGEGASLRSDVFALGLVLHEMLTGQRVFEAKSLAELRALHAQRATSSLSSSVKDVDPALERVVQRCLARDPAERPASARGVLASLPGGGDALQAAVLAGETPSPAMVAAAAVVGDLSVKAAWAWLATAAVALGAVLWLGERVMLHRLVPLPKSTDVLVDRAKTIAAKLAPGESIADEAWGFEANKDYLREMAEEMADRGASTDWKRLAVERPGPLVFWYRASREPLVARTWAPLPPWMPGARQVGHVTRQQPAASAPGMQEIALDPSGRLVRWERVPAPGDTPVLAMLGPLFTEAGLEEAKLTREPGPRLGADGVSAWFGRFPDAPGVARVVASVRDGRVLRFEVDRGDRGRAPATFGSVISAMTLEIAARAIVLGGVPLLIAIVALAVRNLRSGRADRGGALRIALFGAASGVVAQKLWLHFPSSLSDLVDLWFVSDAQPIQWAVIGWLYYCALEPELRRTWPELLVSWSRVLKGRWRDPLVGRHVLFGVIAGLTWAVVWLGCALIPEPGFAPGSTPLELATPALASSRDAVAVAAMSLYPAVLLALGWLIGALIMFRAMRSLPAAVVAVWTIFSLAAWNFLDGPILGMVMAAGVASLVVVVVLRLGLLSSALMAYVCLVLVSLPTAADPSAWYAGRAAMGLAIVIGLAIYGFLVSLAGKPLLGRSVLEG